MIFNRHSDLEGKHALLSPSQPSWLNYTTDKLEQAYVNQMAAARGTRIHAFAKESISLGQKLLDTNQTLNMYVNESIGFGLKPEKVLYYSRHCFGTTDAIDYSETEKKLRISDLKTGTTPAHIEQLKVYAALFCLEYKISPFDISFELRIYQNDDVFECFPEPKDIYEVMRIITESVKILDKLEGDT